jgi:RNA polymerase sigma factor (sigma-70 family)
MDENQSSNAYDLESVSRVLQGDTEAFRNIVEKYQPIVLRLCRSYMKNIEEAEDAAQEIFLRAYKSLSNFKLDKKFLNWLYTIAVNHLKSRYAKIRRFEEHKEMVRNEPVKEQQTPEELNVREELRKEIRNTIDSLPGNLKEVTVLYYLEEMDVQDITEILGISRENVKSRLFRARKKMRVFLEKMQPDDENRGINR